MAEEVQKQAEGKVKDKKNSVDDEEPKHNIDLSELFPEDGHTVKVSSNPDCPICLQPCSFPVQLPCEHVFCFLCIKGVALRSRKCALCRHGIPNEFLENPVLVQVLDKPSGLSPHIDHNHVWFYEGRNGWWQYDLRTNTEIDKAFNNGDKSVELLIAGFVYLIDFENMVQYRRNEPGRKRKIKKNVVDGEKKGVAGIWLSGKRLQPSARNQNDDNATDDSADGQTPRNGTDSVQLSNGQRQNSGQSLGDSIPESVSREHYENMGYIADENVDEDQRLNDITQSLSSTYL